MTVSVRYWYPSVTLAVALVSPRVAVACDPAWLPSIRFPGKTSMVVTFESDTVPDLAAPTFNPDRRAAFLAYRDLPGRPASGQRARVLGTLDAAVPVGADVVLVPWAYGPDCLPLTFWASARWGRVGVPGAVAAWLRPRAGWIAGHPTLDVEFADLEPRWYDDDPRWPHDRADLMSAADYLRFVAVLPTESEIRGPPAALAKRLETWVLRNPALARREPGATMLGNLRRQLGARRVGLVADSSRRRAPSPRAGDWTIEPGVRVGPVTAQATEASLVESFGRRNVGRSTIDMGEGQEATATIVFPGDSARMVAILWRDTVGLSRPERVYINGRKSKWATPEGITLGTPLSVIERLNGGPFNLAGFDWDYGGTVIDGGGGRLAYLGHSDPALGLVGRTLILRLSPSKASAAVSEAESREVSSERIFPSSHPVMRKVDPAVYQIIVEFPPA